MDLLFQLGGGSTDGTPNESIVRDLFGAAEAAEPAVTERPALTPDQNLSQVAMALSATTWHPSREAFDAVLRAIQRCQRERSMDAQEAFYDTWSET